VHEVDETGVRDGLSATRVSTRNELLDKHRVLLVVPVTEDNCAIGDLNPVVAGIRWKNPTGVLVVVLVRVRLAVVSHVDVERHTESVRVLTGRVRVRPKGAMLARRVNGHDVVERLAGRDAAAQHR
jgi:hypothetical protein